MKEKEPKNAEAVIKDIRRLTKRKFSSEEKIRIVISGLRGDESINTPSPGIYFIEVEGAGKQMKWLVE